MLVKSIKLVNFLTYKNRILHAFFTSHFFQNRNRHYFCNMETPDLCPPMNVRLMTKLDRLAFNKIIKIPKLLVPESKLNLVIPHVKKFLLKMDHLKPVQSDDKGFKKIILHPAAVKSWKDIPEKLEELGLTESSLIWDNVELHYENWKCDEILKSVLPENEEGASSFSRIGHIIHINLRDHLIPYKTLIGEVIKDKTSGCRTVVNKLQTIDNTYRNFQMELLCGEADYQVQVKENGISFEFDFSTVYWNPRLASEHERIVKLLKTGDILYDVFAGVGPFSVPIAKKKCFVLANDLNPNSYKYLEENIKINKCSNFIKTYNLDGRDFILNELKNDLIEKWKNCSKVTKIHVTMNLPAMAVEFLNAFEGLLIDYNGPKPVYPLVHVYCFAKGIDDPKNIAKNLVEEHMSHPLKDNLEGIYFVRNVAPNKNMMRVSFYLTDDILLNKNNKRKIDLVLNENSPKKQCTEKDGKKENRKEQGWESTTRKTTDGEETSDRKTTNQ